MSLEDGHCPHCHEGLLQSPINTLVTAGTTATGSCADCGGSGELSWFEDSNDHPSDRQCKTCNGTGRCIYCGGSGLQEQAFDSEQYSYSSSSPSGGSGSFPDISGSGCLVIAGIGLIASSILWVSVTLFLAAYIIETKMGMWKFMRNFYFSGVATSFVALLVLFNANDNPTVATVVFSTAGSFFWPLIPFSGLSPGGEYERAGATVVAGILAFVWSMRSVKGQVRAGE